MLVFDRRNAKVNDRGGGRRQPCVNLLMMLSSTAIFVTALLFQAAPTPGPAREGQSASTDAEMAAVRDEIETLTTTLFTLIGTCEAKLPSSLVSTVIYPFSPEGLESATDAQRARVAPLALAYSNGSRSSRAVTITKEECVAELEALSAEMTAKSGDAH